MRHIRVTAVLLLLLPGSALGASKEIQELQRDLAQLQEQMRQLQSSFDQRMGAVTALVQQALDAANKANTNVSVLNSGVSQTLERTLSQSLTPIAALGAKVDNTNNDVSEVRNSVADLNTQMNKVLSALNDLNGQMKLMQTPVAPPPGAGSGMPPMGAGGAPPSGPPPPQASVLFDNAMRDQNGGKADMAVSEYTDFLRFYPNDPNGASAQFNIGEVHYTQNKLDLAVQDFDAVIERYSDSKLTPDAYYMKGLTLKQSGRRDPAAATFRALIAKFPRSTKSEQAREQLLAMGYTLPGAGAAASGKRKPH